MFKVLRNFFLGYFILMIGVSNALPGQTTIRVSAYFQEEVKKARPPIIGMTINLPNDSTPKEIHFNKDFRPQTRIALNDSFALPKDAKSVGPFTYEHYASKGNSEATGALKDARYSTMARNCMMRSPNSPTIPVMAGTQVLEAVRLVFDKDLNCSIEAKYSSKK